MLFKVALRNVRRSVKDYAVYFLTLAIGVCLFYTFNALDSQTAMVILGRQDGSNTIESIFVIMEVFSVFVAAVLAGLILYANRFLMKRRKRELGTYLLLGMDTGRVARLLAGESLVIGLGALASGLALGILASWGLDKLTIAMFLAVPAEMNFQVSRAAAVETAAYFGVIFLLVTALTGRSVSKAKLIDLVRAERENEEMSQPPLALSVSLFLLGVVSLGTAYAILLVRGLLLIDPLWFLMLGLGTLGSYLIFRSLSGFLLRLTRGHTGYYRGLNMFVLRQWSGKVHTNCLSNTVLSILILLAIGATACAVGLNDTISAMVGQENPYDMTVINYGSDGVFSAPEDFTARFRAVGIDPDETFAYMDSFVVYYNDEAVTGEADGWVYACIPISTYNRLMADRGEKGLTEADLPALTPNAVVNGPAADGLLVVPDEWVPALTPRRQFVNIDFRGDWVETTEQIRVALGDPAFWEGLGLAYNYRLDNYYDLMGVKLLLLYIGLYLGLVFLVTAAAVLALQQLSQAADNAKRYELLSKLGAPKDMRRRAVLRQVALAFLLPLALGLLHAVVGMTAANQVIAVVGKVDALRSSVLTAAGLVVIYGGYFAATCLGAWRAVRTD